MLRSTGHKGAAQARGHGEGYAYPHDDPAGFEVSYLPEGCADGGTIGRPVRERSRRMAVRTGDSAPEFDLEVDHASA